jgi:hypothetical protein
MPFDVKMDLSLNHSMKHWYFYFLPVAFFGSMFFFLEKRTE